MSEGQTGPSAPAPQLEYEFSYMAQLQPPLDAGHGPMGHRLIFSVPGGTVRGERINGTIAAGGGDWIIVAPDGYGQVDVRIQIVTDDDAVIYVQYHGKLEMNDKVNGFVKTGAPTDFTDHYFRTTPRLETGDERYAWVNRTVFLAQGHLVAGGVEYDVYRVL